MSTTRQTSLEPTASGWFLRPGQAYPVLPPPPEDGDDGASGIQATADAATVGSPDRMACGFVESQQAGLTAMLGLANVPAPLPAVKPRAPLPEPPESPRGRAASAAPGARAVAVVKTTSAPREAKPRRRLRRLLPLLAILFVQADLSLRLIWSNTAFMDEALYLRAGQIETAHWLHGTYSSAVAFFPTYFSGSPVIYPPLDALADRIGGLAGARLLSLFFMLGATVLLYAAASRLFDRKAAMAGAAVFAVLGPTQNLGAFATYDAMALFLTALAAWLVIRAQGRLSEPLLATAALVMALADATKYASALWDPVIIALAMTLSQRGGWRRAVVRGLRLALYLLVILGAAVLTAGRSYWTGINVTTLTRPASSAPAQLVLGKAYDWVGAVFLLALLGIAFSSSRPWRDRITCIALTVAVVLAPLEQARIETLTSLQKHVDFGGWFAAIVAGYAMAWMADYNRRKGWRLAAVMLPFILIVGIFQASAMFRLWPNMATAVRIIAVVQRQEPGNCLASEDQLLSYYLPRQLPELNSCNGPYYFAHWDALTRRELFGTAAYVFAIRHHYFAWIEADPDERTTFYAPVVAAARAAGYHLVAVLPNSTTSTAPPIQIWSANPVKVP